MSSDNNEEPFDLTGWGRLVLAIVSVIVGLAMIGVGVQLGGWWVSGTEITETRVWCDDESEYAYEEGEYTSVDHYRDESGAYCQRTTEELDTYAATGWPLWLSAPAWIVITAVLLALLAGGAAVAFYAVMVACDRGERQDFLEWSGLKAWREKH